jgi:hypothetical protein
MPNSKLCFSSATAGAIPSFAVCILDLERFHSGI